MSEKFSVEEFVRHTLLLHMLDDYSKGGMLDQVIANADTSSGKPVHTVKVTVNGVELDYRLFEKMLIDTYDKQVERAACVMFRDLVKDAGCKIQDALTEATRELRDSIESRLGRPIDVDLD